MEVITIAQKVKFRWADSRYGNELQKLPWSDRMTIASLTVENGLLHVFDRGSAARGSPTEEINAKWPHFRLS